jgi:membrane associated rhomboid family serine protease
MQDDQDFRPEPISPLNPVPWVVWLLVLPMVGLEAFLSFKDGISGLAASGWRSAFVQEMAYSPTYMRAMVEAHQYPLNGMWRLVSYPFIHISVSHLLFVAVFLLALGKFVGEAFRWWAVLAIFVISGAVGALVYTAVLPSVQTPLIGGWVPVYGLIGGVSFILWHRLRHDGAKRWRAFTMIGSLLLFRILVSPIFGWGWDVVAEIPAFVTGFVLSYLVNPGGLRDLLQRIRQGGVVQDSDES